MSSRVPSYRLHKPSGKAVVTLNGKDHYLGEHNTPQSKAAYQRLIAEWQALGQRSAPQAGPSGISIATLCVRYLDHCRDWYPDTKWNETKQTELALRYMEPYLMMPAHEFGPLSLKAVRQIMLEATSAKTGDRLSRQYINKMVDRLVRMFRWAAENELVPISCHAALVNVRGLQRGRTTAPEAAKVETVDDKMVEKTIKCCCNIIADMIRLQRLTGMRPGEVVRLTPAMIVAEGDIWRAEPEEHKTAWRGKKRVIFIGPKAQEILSKYLNRAADKPLFSPAEAVAQRNKKRTRNCKGGNRAGYGRLTRNPEQRKLNYHDSYDTQSYGRAIMYACDRAFPVPEGATEDEAKAWRKKHRWSPNQLRHSAATEIRKKFGLEAAQVILGHAKADVTQIYADRDTELARSVVQSIG